jgi:hypothetical protein
MEWLYSQSKQFDAEITSRIPKWGKFQFGGRTPPMLENAFDWYAVSACRYVRLVGQIAYRLDSARPIGREYSKAVIPDVETYRDKVAAHFAWSTENNRDNPAERIVSVLPNVIFNRDTYWASGMVLYRRSGESSSSSDEMRPWSISKTHEELRRRYAPDESEAALVK